MGNDELKTFINELQAESHGLIVASNDAYNENDDETAAYVDDAREALDAAIVQLKRFYKARQNF